MTRKEVVVIDYPPHSPDLAPADFFLLLQLKGALKEKLLVYSDIRNHGDEGLPCDTEKRSCTHFFRNCTVVEHIRTDAFIWRLFQSPDGLIRITKYTKRTR